MENFLDNQNLDSQNVSKDWRSSLFCCVVPAVYFIRVWLYSLGTQDNHRDIPSVAPYVTVVTVVQKNTQLVSVLRPLMNVTPLYVDPAALTGLLNQSEGEPSGYKESSLSEHINNININKPGPLHSSMTMNEALASNSPDSTLPYITMKKPLASNIEASSSNQQKAWFPRLESLDWKPQLKAWCPHLEGALYPQSNQLTIMDKAELDKVLSNIEQETEKERIITRNAIACSALTPEDKIQMVKEADAITQQAKEEKNMKAKIIADNKSLTFKTLNQYRPVRPKITDADVARFSDDLKAQKIREQKIVNKMREQIIADKNTVIEDLMREERLALNRVENDISGREILALRQVVNKLDAAQSQHS